MATGYRSFSTLEATALDPFLVTREQVVSWLRHKKLDADRLLPDATSELAPGTVAWHGAWTTPDSRHTERFRLREQKPTGTWTTTVTISSREGEAWLLVDVSHDVATARDGNHQRAIKPSVPVLIKRLGEAVDLTDGNAPLRHEPEILAADRLPELLAVLSSPTRRGPVFVAGSDESLPLDKWRRHVARLVKETVGLGATYVLAPSATRALTSELGESFAVPPGAIRTYLSKVAPENPEDARRHRILSTESVANRDDRSIQRMLADVARNQTLDLPLPKDVQRQLNRLDREEALLLVEQSPDRPLDLQELPDEPVREPTPSSDSRTNRTPGDATVPPQESSRERSGELVELASGRRVLSSIRKLLGANSTTEITKRLQDALKRSRSQEVTIEELAAREKAAATQLNDQRDLIESLRHDLEDVELDGGVEAEENARLRDLLAKTEKSLTEAMGHLAREAQFDGWDEISQPEEVRDPPTDLDQVLERFGDLVHLEFTGETDELYDLRDSDTLGTFATKTWAALQALNDFVRAKKDGAVKGDLRQYVDCTPQGYVGIAKLKVALVESETVRSNPKFWAERLLPVPSCVDPGGRIHMEAHIKIAKKRSISPRLYFYDDVARSGKIYVGYIGRHMTNSQSN